MRFEPTQQLPEDSAHSLSVGEIFDECEILELISPNQT
jgi:hypothetical protein